MAGCTNEVNGPAQQEGVFTLKNFSNTGCKPTAPSRGEENPDPEYLELKAVDNGGLYVIHANILFNCIANRFEAHVSIDGQTIIVSEVDLTEYEIKAPCKCPYDLSYEIGPLEEGKTYTITVVTYDGQDKYNKNTVPDSRETTFSFVYSPTLSMKKIIG